MRSPFRILAVTVVSLCLSVPAAARAQTQARRGDPHPALSHSILKRSRADRPSVPDTDVRKARVPGHDEKAPLPAAKPTVPPEDQPSAPAEDPSDDEETSPGESPTSCDGCELAGSLWGLFLFARRRPIPTATIRGAKVGGR